RIFFGLFKKVFQHREIEGFSKPAHSGNEGHVPPFFHKLLDEKAFVYVCIPSLNDLFEITFPNRKRFFHRNSCSKKHTTKLRSLQLALLATFSDKTTQNKYFSN